MQILRRNFPIVAAAALVVAVGVRPAAADKFAGDFMAVVSRSRMTFR